MRLLASLILVPLAACADDPVSKIDAPFTLSDPGKADGSDLLPAADQQRLETAFASVVARGEQTITELEDEIADLERDHAVKQQEADALVTRIASREQELRDQYDRNLILCAFFPNPATCVLANYLANDSTLRSYKQQLEAARNQQRTIAAEISRYTTKRDDIRASIDAIRANKDELMAMLRDSSSPTFPTELASAPAAGRAYWRANAMGDVQRLIGTEIALLVELRNAAVELSNVLDSSLATLRALDQSVDELVRRSRDQFMDLVKALLSGDPAAAAEDWLEDELARKTRELLNKLDWPLNEFVRFLVDGNDDALADRILRKLLDDATGPAPLTFTANTPVRIYDLTTARSAIDVSDTRTITSIEVFVDIEHTFIGDLNIELLHAGESYLLVSGVGGDQDNLMRTFAVPEAVGAQLKGRWTLAVTDTAERDTGTLKHWLLVAK